MDDLITRLTAAISETENAARAALAGYPSSMGNGYEGCEPAVMSSVWRAAYHEVFQVMTEDPSAAFISRHRPGASVERMKRRKLADCGPANVYPAQHIARHDPASVLRGCAADRKLIARGGPFCDCADADRPPMDPATNWTVPIPHHYDCSAYEAAKIMAERYGVQP